MKILADSPIDERIMMQAPAVYLYNTLGNRKMTTDLSVAVSSGKGAVVAIEMAQNTECYSWLCSNGGGG